jgi:hypothetical protein
MVFEGGAAVEVDGGVAVIDFEVEHGGSSFAGFCFGKVEDLGSDTLTAMFVRDKELIDPRAFAAVLQAVLETEDNVASRVSGDTDQVSQSESRVRE